MSEDSELEEVLQVIAMRIAEPVADAMELIARETSLMAAAKIIDTVHDALQDEPEKVIKREPLDITPDSPKE